MYEINVMIMQKLTNFFNVKRNTLKNNKSNNDKNRENDNVYRSKIISIFLKKLNRVQFFFRKYLSIHDYFFIYYFLFSF